MYMKWFIIKLYSFTECCSHHDTSKRFSTCCQLPASCTFMLKVSLMSCIHIHAGQPPASASTNPAHQHCSLQASVTFNTTKVLQFLSHDYADYMRKTEPTLSFSRSSCSCSRSSRLFFTFSNSTFEKNTKETKTIQKQTIPIKQGNSHRYNL